MLQLSLASISWTNTRQLSSCCLFYQAWTYVCTSAQKGYQIDTSDIVRKQHFLFTKINYEQHTLPFNNCILKIVTNTNYSYTWSRHNINVYTHNMYVYAQPLPTTTGQTFVPFLIWWSYIFWDYIKPLLWYLLIPVVFHTKRKSNVLFTFCWLHFY